MKNLAETEWLLCRLPLHGNAVLDSLSDRTTYVAANPGQERAILRAELKANLCVLFTEGKGKGGNPANPPKDQ